MFKKILTSLFVIVACLNGGCVGVGITSDNKIDPATPTISTSSDVVLVEYPGEQKPYKNGTMINLLIKNLGDDTIVFSSDYGLKVWSKDGQDWKSVENNVHYPEREWLLKPGNENPLGLPLLSSPYIPDLKSTIIIRVEVNGYSISSPDRLVNASIEIPLEP